MDIAGGAEVVQRAGHEAGWVAALFAMLVVCGFGMLFWIVRQQSIDLRSLRTYQTTTMAEQQDKTIEIMSRCIDVMSEVRLELKSFRQTLDRAPCGAAVGDVLSKFMRESQQGKK